MKNFWISKIDKALRLLGFDQELLDWLNDKEKEALVINEYLALLTGDRNDCAAMSLEEMAAFIIDNRTNSII
jgi:uncharacterized protein with PIN domain